MATKPGTAICLLLAYFVSTTSAALLLSRPDGDCISPAVSATTHEFYPKNYQLTSIQSQSSSSTGLSTVVDFAEDFSVEYRGTYKVVKNKRVDETYVLYQCGSPNPLSSSDAELAVPSNTKVFEIPLVSVAVDDSAAAGLLAELGVIDRVAFANEFSYNQCYQAINACGNTAVAASQPVDYDTSAANDAEFEASVDTWKNASTVQSGKVDAIFTSAATTNPKTIAVTAFADPGVLNRAEWVKFVAVFFNKEVEAERLFNDISSSYSQLSNAARAAAGDNGKVVAWISKLGDTISMDYTAYKTQYMRDAGGRLLPTAGLVAAGAKEVKGQYSTVKYNFNASVPAEKEAFLSQLRGVDIIFDDSYAAETSNLPSVAAFKTLYGLTDAQAAALPAVAAGQLWTFNGRLGRTAGNGLASSDWFETSLARPDLVLADFVQVITPAAAPANTPTSWLRQLSDSSSLKYSTAADCPTINTAANAADRCQRAQPARICPNAYRDCATGKLMTVTDPAQRCEAQTVCPDAVATNGGDATASTPRNAAARPAAAGVTQLLLTLLGAALLALML